MINAKIELVRFDVNDVVLTSGFDTMCFLAASGLVSNYSAYGGAEGTWWDLNDGTSVELYDWNEEYLTDGMYYSFVSGSCDVDASYGENGEYYVYVDGATKSSKPTSNNVLSSLDTIVSWLSSHRGSN